MHTFQPISTDQFDLSPFRIIGKEWMLITAQTGDRVNTMTASWGGLGVMWGKDAAFIVVRDSRYTREIIDASDTFSLSFFPAGYRGALKYLGAVSGRDEDKIQKAGMHVNYREEIPFIDEASTVIVCKKLCKQPLHREGFTMDWIDEKWYADKDYHNLYIGEVVQILAR